MASEQNLTKQQTRSSDEEKFFNYYAEQSQTPQAYQRFESIRNVVTEKLADWTKGASSRELEVADIGCNAGTQCMMWAADGHAVHGIDVNSMLLQLASERASEANLNIDYVLGSATNLPWPDESMDVCLVPELLEHVADWRACLDECTRILKPNGVIYLSTTNYLCPKQQEFALPFYSWYPSVLKARYERLAMSSRPQLANYAQYPAVNWFTFYSLRAELSIRGLTSFDRFDVVDTRDKGALTKLFLSVIRKIAPIRFLGHVATPYTVIVGLKLPKSAAAAGSTQ